MSDYYFAEYLPNLPREQWGPFDELSFYLGLRVRRGDRVVLPDGKKYTTPRLSFEEFTNKGAMECELHGYDYKIQKALIYYANAPMLVDPFDLVFLDDNRKKVIHKIVKFEPGRIYGYLAPVSRFEAVFEIEVVERCEYHLYPTYLKVRAPNSSINFPPCGVPVTSIMGVECFGFSTIVVKATDVKGES